jgi:hypothetical protein
LRELGLNNQRLAINGVFHASERSDAVACAIEAWGSRHWTDAASLRALPQDRVPLRAFDTVGSAGLARTADHRPSDAATCTGCGCVRRPIRIFRAWTRWPMNWPPPGTG